MTESLIPVDEPSSSFQDFLKDDNKRIFFSAGYGLGKTYFLQDFFKINNKVKYDTYHLFPVRYHISGNEDIIKLLKYDIFVEACKKYEDTSKNNKSIAKKIFDAIIKIIKDGKLSMALLSSVENMVSVAGVVFPAMSLLGRSIDAMKSVYAFWEELKTELKNVEQHSAGEVAKKYNVDNITASDEFSVLVQNMVNELKGDKRSVLILDDLDRIDPEHIFRILNIFSAHDMANTDNEFEFDHVIIVGDMDNIREMFHHRYGRKVEFQGYFDKFYSTTPYIFDNNKAVYRAMKGLLPRLPAVDRAALGQVDFMNTDKDFVLTLLKMFILAAFEGKAINIRGIYKRIADKRPIIQRSNLEYTHTVEPILNQILDLYMSFFSSKDIFLETFKNVANNFPVAVEGHMRKTQNIFNVYNQIIVCMMDKLDSKLEHDNNKDDIDEYKKIRRQYDISYSTENGKIDFRKSAESVIYSLSYLYCKHILR